MVPSSRGGQAGPSSCSRARGPLVLARPGSDDVDRHDRSRAQRLAVAVAVRKGHRPDRQATRRVSEATCASSSPDGSLIGSGRSAGRTRRRARRCKKRKAGYHRSDWCWRSRGCRALGLDVRDELVMLRQLGRDAEGSPARRSARGPTAPLRLRLRALALRGARAARRRGGRLHPRRPPAPQQRVRALRPAGAPAPADHPVADGAPGLLPGGREAPLLAAVNAARSTVRLRRGGRVRSW
jgi:hypothetical protein